MSEVNQAYVDNLADEVAALRAAMASDSTHGVIKRLVDQIEQLNARVDLLSKQQSQKQATNWTNRDIASIARDTVEPALKAMVSALMDDDEEVEKRLVAKLHQETSAIKFEAASSREVASRNKDAAVRFLTGYANLYTA